MMTLADVIEQIADLVAQGRCVGAAARDADGRTVAVLSKLAVCFCPAGAARRATHGLQNGDTLQLLAYERMDDYAYAQRRSCLPTWNDSTPHADVVAAIRELARAEREQIIARIDGVQV